MEIALHCIFARDRIIDTCVFIPLTEQDQYDVREDVTSTETLLQTEHYQERAWAKTSIQVYRLKIMLYFGFLDQLFLWVANQTLMAQHNI